MKKQIDPADISRCEARRRPPQTSGRRPSSFSNFKSQISLLKARVKPSSPTRTHHFSHHRVGNCRACFQLSSEIGRICGHHSILAILARRIDRDALMPRRCQALMTDACQMPHVSASLSRNLLSPTSIVLMFPVMVALSGDQVHTLTIDNDASRGHH